MFHVKHQLDLLQSFCKDINIDLSNDQCNQFMKYYNLLIETNKVMNLTAITDFDEVVIKHFIDSIYLGKYIDLHNYTRLMDLGTGAGFPGVPLKIVYPNLKITLVDSLNKRIQFLNDVIKELNLGKIEAIHDRAETLAHNNDYREKYDLIVSRAVSNLSTLNEYCIPFIKKEGYFISYKSGDIEEELENSNKAISILGSKVDRIEKYNLPGTDINRSLVIIKKEKSTEQKYPRRSGIPQKKPL